MKFLTLLFLIGCNQWVRPRPEPSHVRNVYEQKATTVDIEMTCAPFADMPAFDDFDEDALAETRTGRGVMVSDWQVLTALHVVDCLSTIPTIYVYTMDGKKYRFAPEKEWRDVDISRIQMASADSFHPDFPPPELRYSRVSDDELLSVGGYLIGESDGGPYYHAPTSKGWSGTGVYDFSGYLVGVHLSSSEEYQFFGRLEEGMVP